MSHQVNEERYFTVNDATAGRSEPLATDSEFGIKKNDISSVIPLGRSKVKVFHNSAFSLSNDPNTVSVQVEYTEMKSK